MQAFGPAAVVVPFCWPSPRIDSLHLHARPEKHQGRFHLPECFLSVSSHDSGWDANHVKGDSDEGSGVRLFLFFFRSASTQVTGSEVAGDKHQVNKMGSSAMKRTREKDACGKGNHEGQRKAK